MVRLRSPAPMSCNFIMGDFPSGQRGQTVNLLSTTSLVRIQHPPPQKRTPIWVSFFVVLGWCECDQPFQFIENAVRKLAESRCLLVSKRLGRALCQRQSLQHPPALALGFLFVVRDADSVCLSMLCIGIWFVHFS